MKTISPKVQDILDQVAEMDVNELREFRTLLAQRFDLTSYVSDSDNDGDNLAGSAVPKNPITPVISGAQRN